MSVLSTIKGGWNRLVHSIRERKILGFLSEHVVEIIKSVAGTVISTAILEVYLRPMIAQGDGVIPVANPVPRISILLVVFFAMFMGYYVYYR